MKISIILPTFNSEKTIFACLESIISQTYQDFEVLIIDGISSDRTLEISKSFNDARIKISSEKDQGIYDAMNKGIALAKGEWFYFIGSDDILYDYEILEKISLTLKETKSKIVYGNVLIEGNTSWSKDGIIYDQEFDLKKILNKNICHQSIFYHKEVFEDHKYNMGYSICADYELNLKLFSKYSFKYIDLVIAKFNAGGLSSTKTDLNFNLADVVIENYFARLHESEFSLFNYRLPHHIKKHHKLGKILYLSFVYLKHRIINIFK